MGIIGYHWVSLGNRYQVIGYHCIIIAMHWVITTSAASVSFPTNEFKIKIPKIKSLQVRAKEPPELLRRGRPKRRGGRPRLHRQPALHQPREHNLSLFASRCRRGGSFFLEKSARHKFVNFVGRVSGAPCAPVWSVSHPSAGQLQVTNSTVIFIMSRLSFSASSLTDYHLSVIMVIIRAASRLSF